MRKRLINIVTNPIVPGFIIGLIIIFFLPPIFDKYEVDHISTVKTENYITYYNDLDGDGISEKLRYYPDFLQRPAIIIFSKEKIISQWNFQGTLARTHDLCFDDYDGDGKKEVYLFAYKDDKILLNYFDPYDEGLLKRDRFVDTFERTLNVVDFSVYPVGHSDINGDGKKEFLFIINTAFSLQPRNVYAFDIANDIIYRSPENGEGLALPTMYDITDDDSPEVFVRCSAVGNNPDKDFPYSDQYCWLMVYKNNTDLLFPPTKVGNYPSYMDVQPYVVNGNRYIAALYIYSGTEAEPCKLMLFSTEGKLIREKSLGQYSDKFHFTRLITEDIEKRNSLYIAFGNGEVLELDENLEIVKEKKVEGVYRSLRNYANGLIDIDHDGNREVFYFADLGEKVVVCRNDFEHPVSFDLFGDELINISVVERGQELPGLYFECQKQGYMYTYQKNILYYLKYLVYAIIIAAVSGLVLLITRLQQYRIKQRYEAEKKMAELQIVSITNQTDSHFTLNILNNIGALFNQHDNEQANYIFGKYTRLLRSQVISSDRAFVSLRSELEDVENYLDLERFRLNSRFGFSIDVGKDVPTDLQIPKTLIHTFAENSVKHGLFHKQEYGELKIVVRKKMGYCIIAVKDNGVGRKEAKNYNEFSTGKGMLILDQILDLYYELTGKQIKYKIQDLKEPMGTKATISIAL